MPPTPPIASPSPPPGVSLQPPFPPAGTSSSPPNPHPTHHPVAETVINTAAQHIIPSYPDPPLESSAASVGSSKGNEYFAPSGQREEERPTVDESPLDEMTSREGVNEGREVRFALSQSQEEYRLPGSDSMDDKGRHSPTARIGTDEDTRDEARPAFGATREFGSIRMGASALISALNALPWEDDEQSEDEDVDEALATGSPSQGSRSVIHDKRARPNFMRLGSSLNIIRPMAPPSFESPDPGDTSLTPHEAHRAPSLHFPFRQNAIARKARRPGTTEMNYQLASSTQRSRGDESETSSDGGVPLPKGFVSRQPTASDDGSSDVCSLTGPEAQMVNDQITKEEDIAEAEEDEEILRSARESKLSFVDGAESHGHPSDLNLGAALRDGKKYDNDVNKEQMPPNQAEKRMLRKEKLAGKLMEVFGLEEREEVLEEMKCWLLCGVMLKGYMYLTRQHICFFANMPNENNLLVKSGPLYKKASHTKLNTKFWVVLKNDVLSWYESTLDLYFPKGNISLQYCLSCDPVSDLKFKVRTSERSYTFTADTEGGRDDWVKTINKVMFKTRHEGESIKMIIPLAAIVDVEKSPTLEFAETIEIKCVDPEDQMSVDSYFFASFPDNDHAFSAIQQLIEDRSDLVNSRIPSEATIHAPDVLQNSHATITRQMTDSDKTVAVLGHSPFKKLGSVLRPLISRREGDEEDDEEEDSSMSSHKHQNTAQEDEQTNPPATLHEGQTTDEPQSVGHEGYPPRQFGTPPASMQQDDGKNWGPSWIRKPASKLFGTSPGGSSTLGKSPTDTLMTITDITQTPSQYRTGGRRKDSVTVIVEPSIKPEDEGESGDDDPVDLRQSFSSPDSRTKRSARQSWASESSSGGSQMVKSKSDFSMLGSESGHSEHAEMVKKFRSFFALSEKEELIDHFPGFLYRVLPVSGRFFVSTNYFCFRSSQLLYKTKMIIPIRDLYGLKAQKAFRFGHSGLIIVIKGHEELFLEFSSSARRKACIAILEERMEHARLAGNMDKPNPHKIEARIMEELDETTPAETKSPWAMSPSPLFGSATSTSFLEFKTDPMRITCLTIGSRGDVQPYIALCKGLQAEGHTCKIATHGEYREWVEGHGIAFESVGGDPAELMQMCVDNGMFTVSFLKEGLQKFRGWLDDLLTSSWEACQGSDLLIESPSAMSGLHIAEALQIPYYRAFTMPWTRTRAYPHAFAVPEHRRGGSYNYMTYTMFDQVFWRAISGQINRWRRNTLGLEGTTFDKMEQHKTPFLYNFSQTMVPPPLDWTEWIHVTGYWFLDKADEKVGEKNWNAPEGLVEFIDQAHENGKKVVYIGFGSIVVSDPEEMTRCVVKAVMNSGVCAILSKGWSDRGTKAKGEPSGGADGADGIKYPPEIYAIDSIDHGWLFPKIDAACHHGGAGTTGASLRAGIPTIIKPFFGDQAFWAERVESMNVGSAIRKLTAPHLAAALTKATTDEKQITKAKVVGEMIRHESGVARAIEAIYRDLEYAKSIIKPLPSSEDKSPEKIASLLDPIASNDLMFAGLRSRSRSRSQSSPRKMSSNRAPPADDDGWSVVSGGSPRSGSGNASLLASPEQRPTMSLGAVFGREVLRASLPNPFGKWKAVDEMDH